MIDLQKCKPWEVPIKSISAFQAELGAQFRCMIVRNFILNASTPFVWAWKSIRVVLNESGKAKTTLIGENTCDELKELVCRCQLLEEYGGTAKMPAHYWPPVVPPYCSNHIKN